MEAFGVTHTGLVRTINQDCFEIRQLPDQALLAMICDGMGGPNGGEVAAAMAAEWIANRMLTAYSPAMEDGQVLSLMKTAVEEANHEIYARGQQSPDYSGMGTTVVLALLRGGTALIASVGDSRAYLSTRVGDQHRLVQITHDHSVVQELVDDGAITNEEARSHPRRNIITRALGTQRQIECDCFTVELLRGDRLLLCSDGLTNMVDDAQLLSLLVLGESLQKTAEDMLQASIEAGAHDNVTVLLVSA